MNSTKEPDTPVSVANELVSPSPNATPRTRVESDIAHLGDVDDGTSPVKSPTSVMVSSSLATGEAVAIGKKPRSAPGDVENQTTAQAAGDEEAQGGWTRSRKIRICMILALLLVILAVAIPVAVTQSQSSDRGGVAGSGSEGSGPPPPPPPTPTLSPTSPIPTAAPITLRPTSSLQPSTGPTVSPTTAAPTPDGGFLLALFATVTPMETLLDPLTPQHSAWIYLRILTNRGEAETDKELLQRYAVVTMTFSLQPGPSGNLRTAPFLHECEWGGITCKDNNTVVEKIEWVDRGLNGVIPDEVAVLSELTVLDVGENEVKGVLPEKLFEITTLKELFVHDNQMTGTLSESFSKLELLESFYGGENNFNGTFPRGLGSPGTSSSSVRPLRRLSLYKNKISGPIPDDLNLRSLKYLDIGHNEMTGELPYTWGRRMQSLTEMYIDHNRFRGEIPSSWPGIRNGRMRTYHFNDNLLTGFVPGGYDALGIMQSIDMRNNDFTGFHEDFCSLLVFIAGEVTNFRTDCDICNCKEMCDVQCGRGFGRNP